MSTEARPALIVQPSRPDLHSDREQPKELTDDDLTFLSNYTGRTDLDALRQHVYSVQRSTTDTMWAYGCIQNFLFLQPRIMRHPLYAQVLSALLGDHDKRILDTRQLKLDGVPQSSILASDITAEYWDFGKELFMDKDTQQVQTAWGSFTETAFIDAGRPLAILKGSFAYLWAGAVLHVLGYDDVIAFLTHACKMLAEGGVFFGMAGGQDTPGEWKEMATPTGKGTRYLHNDASLTALMKKVGFSEARVERSSAEFWGVQSATRRGGIDDRLVLLTFSATK